MGEARDETDPERVAARSLTPRLGSWWSHLLLLRGLPFPWLQ